MKIPGIIGFLLFFASCESEIADPQNINEEIDRIIMPYIISSDRVGIGIGIYDNGETNFYSYGTKHIINGGAIDENTLFEIGSITKTFTTTLLSKLSIDGEVSINDNIQQFFPSDVNIPKYGENEIKLINLANHTSSLPRMPNNIPDNADNTISNTFLEPELFEFLNNYNLPRAIGNKSEYSNIGMGILGYILKNKMNRTYYELLSDEILTPLNMNSTVLEFFNSSSMNIAQGYMGIVEQDESQFSEVFEGAGAIKSNMADMLKYLEANLSDKTDAIYVAIQQTHIKTVESEKKGMDIGLAWFIETIDDGQGVIFHDGGTAGFNSFIGFNKETKKGVVVLTNSNNPLAAGQVDIGFEIMKAVQKY